MPNINYFSTFKPNKLSKPKCYLLIILLLRASICEEDGDPTATFLKCNDEPSLSEDQCFDNIIKFDNKHYQASNFARNKNGDLVIEFSEDNEISSSRLFYGLTKDGKYFFSNQSSSTKELDINIDNINTDYGFYNSYNFPKNLHYLYLIHKCKKIDF